MLAKNLVQARVALSLLSIVAFAAGCSEEAGNPPTVNPPATSTAVIPPRLTPTHTATSVIASTASPTQTNTVSVPTATPTTATAQCADPRPAPTGNVLYIDDINLAAGTTSATITAKLVTSAGVAGTQSDIQVAPGVSIHHKANGKPDCTVNAAIDKTATSFAFRPAGCVGSACTSVRGLVLSTDNIDPIPSGSVLFTCNVDVTTGGELAVTGVIFSTPAGQQVDGATGRSGIVCVPGAAQPTATLTATPTAVQPTVTTTPTTSSGQVCASPRPAPSGPAIYVDDLNLPLNATTGTITAFLVTAVDVAGTQNDIQFAPGVTIHRKANGHPDCTVNPDIDKTASSFAFRPSACVGAACTGIRALVLSTDNVDPIPTGSALFTCNIDVTGPGGELAVSGVILSTPAGVQVAGASGRSGIVCVEGAQLPTPTPSTTLTPTIALATATFTAIVPTNTATVPVIATATPTPTVVVSTCASPRPAPAGPALYIDDTALPQASTSGVITASLAAGGKMVAGAQNDLEFPSGIQVKAKVNGHPDCTVNAAIDKTATSFSFRPTGCSGTECTGLRAIVLSTDNLDVIPDGSALYTCNVAVSSGGVMAISGIILSDPDGNRVPGALGRDGIICVEGELTPTPTLTPTSPSVTATATVPAQATATITATVTATPTFGLPTSTPTVVTSTCPAPQPTPGGPAVYVVDAALPNGTTTAVITVKLASGGQQVAGTQNDLTLPAGIAVPAKLNGRPDCSVNPDIDKTGTSFSFLPTGCQGAACSGLRAIVISVDNLLAIADGAVLYTCNANVSNGGTIAVSDVFFGDPDGNRVPNASGRDGIICIEGQQPTPTVTDTPGAVATSTPTAAAIATATATPTAASAATATPAIEGCPSPRPAPGGPAVWIGDISAAPGSETSIDVLLATGGNNIVGTQNEISFPVTATIAALPDGRPDCVVNAAINKSASFFGFDPSGCVGAACTAVKAIVVATDNLDPITDGSVLYTCRVLVSANATGTLALAVDNVILSDMQGNRVDAAGAQSGNICTGPAPTVSEATLLGANEVPPVASDATGHAEVSPTADGISVTLTTSLTEALAAHIHCGPVGVNGGVVFALYSVADGPLPSPLQKQLSAADLMPVGSVTTLAQAIAAIQGGDCYVNVHTQANQGGEIRGQLAMHEFHATLTGAGESSPVDTQASGTAAVGVNASKIVVTLNTTQLVNPIAAHIHFGMPGVDGPVIFGLYSLADGALPATLTKTLTAADLMPTAGVSTFAEAVTAISSGGTYTNVHTQAHGGGEIRGQIQ